MFKSLTTTAAPRDAQHRALWAKICHCSFWFVWRHLSHSRSLYLHPFFTSVNSFRDRRYDMNCHLQNKLHSRLRSHQNPLKRIREQLHCKNYRAYHQIIWKKACVFYFAYSFLIDAGILFSHLHNTMQNAIWPVGILWRERKKRRYHDDKVMCFLVKHPFRHYHCQQQRQQQTAA